MMIFRKNVTYLIALFYLSYSGISILYGVKRKWVEKRLEQLRQRREEAYRKAEEAKQARFRAIMEEKEAEKTRSIFETIQTQYLTRFKQLFWEQLLGIRMQMEELLIRPGIAASLRTHVEKELQRIKERQNIVEKAYEKFTRLVVELGGDDFSNLSKLHPMKLRFIEVRFEKLLEHEGMESSLRLQVEKMFNRLKERLRKEAKTNFDFLKSVLKNENFSKFSKEYLQELESKLRRLKEYPGHEPLLKDILATEKKVRSWLTNYDQEEVKVKTFYDSFKKAPPSQDLNQILAETESFFADKKIYPFYLKLLEVRKEIYAKLQKSISAIAKGQLRNFQGFFEPNLQFWSLSYLENIRSYLKDFKKELRKEVLLKSIKAEMEKVKYYILFKKFSELNDKYSKEFGMKGLEELDDERGNLFHEVVSVSLFFKQGTLYHSKAKKLRDDLVIFKMNLEKRKENVEHALQEKEKLEKEYKNLMGKLKSKDPLILKTNRDALLKQEKEILTLLKLDGIEPMRSEVQKWLNNIRELIELNNLFAEVEERKKDLARKENIFVIKRKIYEMEFRWKIKERIFSKGVRQEGIEAINKVLSK